MRKKLQVGDRTLVYEWTGKPVKNLNLRVDGDGNVRVSSPPSVSAREVERFVARHAARVLRLQEERAVRPENPPLRLTDGDVLTVLGNRITVRLRAGRPACAADGGTVTLSVPDPADRVRTAEAFYGFLRSLTPLVGEEALDRVLPRFRRWYVPRPVLRWKRMSSRWGSCRRDRGAVSMNLRLLFTTPDLIDAVLAHELAHFVVPNHSAEFHRVLREAMPEAADRGRALRSASVPL